MHLKKALWRSTMKEESKKTEDEKSEETSTTMTAVEELANSLMDQRLYREVTLALTTSLRDCRAEFSFLRLCGLRSLLNFLKSVTASDSTINLFCETQSIPDLQVVPVLFQHSLKVWEEVEDNEVDNLNLIFGIEPMKITSPATDSETVIALRVLEGCSLLHCSSTILAHQYNAVQVLTHILATRGKQEQAACLDALIAIMLDSSPNLTDFEDSNGIEEVAVLIRDKQVDENLRLRCGEFLLLLIGHVNGRERPPMATAHEDIRRLLGEKTASLIWAASQFGSTLDPEERVIALHIQARRVLESLDLY